MKSFLADWMSQELLMTKRVPIGDFHKDILETLAAKTLIQMMGLEDDPG